MNHEKDESTDHMNDSRCHYQARFDNRIYTCRVSRSVFPLPLPPHHILLVADPIMIIGAKELKPCIKISLCMMTPKLHYLSEMNLPTFIQGLLIPLPRLVMTEESKWLLFPKCVHQMILHGLALPNMHGLGKLVNTLIKQVTSHNNK